MGTAQGLCRGHIEICRIKGFPRTLGALLGGVPMIRATICMLGAHWRTPFLETPM